MKRIYIIAVLFLLGIWPATAQPFWHPDLGNAPAGSIPLSYDTTSYSFETTGGLDSGYDTEAMKNSLNQQLLAANFSWVRVMSIESYTDEQFTITLQLDINQGTGARAVYFGTNSRRLEILQNSQSQNPEPDIPSGMMIRIYPGCPRTITLETSNVGQTYSLMTFSEGEEVTLATVVGTGSAVSFELVLTPGEYWIQNANNSNFTVKYAYAFSVRYGFNYEQVSIDANGGVVYLPFWSIMDGDEEIYVQSDEDIHFLEDPFDELKGGYSNIWDPHMKIYYGCDTEASEPECYIQVVSPPNLSPNAIINDSYLCNRNGAHVVFEQPAGGTIKSVPVTYRPERQTMTMEVTIADPQPFVTYKVFKDSVQVSSRTAFTSALTQTVALSDGDYSVIAEYEDDEGNYAYKELNGAMYCGNNLVLLSDTRNWIYSRTYNDQGNSQSDITYYDGLGYASQEVSVGAAQGGNYDLVRPIVYDELHREARKYLPYARTNGYGAYDSDATTNQDNFYRLRLGISHSAYAYTYDEYEASPLNRILKSYKPGVEYHGQGHYVGNDYIGNDSLTIARLDIDPVNNWLHVNGYYAANMLSGVRTTDEDGAVTVAYTDHDGNTIYEERQNRLSDTLTECVITRYVYDDCGRLAWVVTPEGTDQLVQGQYYADTCALARNCCYLYYYDSRSRQIEKRMPGRAAEYMVYDLGDRLVMQQDGNLREEKQWLTYEYDAHGRVVEQSLVTDTATQGRERRTALQTPFDSGTTPALYTSATAEPVYRHVYDSYPATLRSELAFQTVPSVTDVKDNRTTGLATYEKLAVINQNGIVGYRERVFYYDSKGRTLQTVECDDDGDHLLRISNRYDFIGNLLAQRESYTYGNKTDSLDRTFEYDSRNRLLKETAQFNGGEQAVVAYTYDDLGQLTGKTYGTGTYAIHETMDYNLQGWLTEKSSELFDMRLDYFESYRDWLTPSYRGNIATWWWQHKNIDGTANGDEYAYGYCYDDLSRLTAAQQFWSDSEGPEDSFTEKGISYDKNSNILTLNRTSLSAGDVKSYQFSYNGNQRIKETTANSEYAYDANGNITHDAVNGLEISYNFLNLPTKLFCWGDYAEYYDYLADGTKMRHEYQDGQERIYAGSLVYDQGVFESAPFGGGRIVGTYDDSEAHYFLTDHIGSTRVVAKVTTAGRDDLDRKDYYPFGKAWTQADMPTSDNRYTFSGKEQQHLRGQVVNYADFEARFYDSETGIFLQQDPLSEYSFQVSPYAYCGNNPINRIDLDGKRWDDPIQDAEIARQIKDAINAALNALISQEKRINNRINKINDNTKLSREKKEERIAKEKQKLAEIDIQQDNLTYLSKGIDKMGSEDNPNIFTFETVEDEDGLTSTNTDGVTTMRNNGTFYNRVHEATHGAQTALGDLRVNQNGQALGGLSTPAREIQAYQNQAVLAGYETLPFSDHGGRPTKLKGITAPWIKGIKNSNGQYVY